ncbi:hypothetical protein EZV62_027872 [Acer yangbiense]|uniref:Band 7 domain-containing protein n=1 Tax=Acer yangbiense TaxID=1000413 RepID=A0A5C7GP70_9ROSI|nr:hypothetical protein EZV62_027872 [Acer yangbiense]
MGQALGCIQVDQSTVAIKETFGMFDDVLDPGCHCLPWCLGSQVAGHLSLRVQQLDVRCETKTKDNVFVNVVASIQYRALADKAEDAFYKLSNTRSQIQAYVFDVIRASVPKLDLDATFEQKNDIAKAVEEELEKAMSHYGFEIVQTLIVDIEPDEHVKRAMNEINAAARMRVAANEKAEAEKYCKSSELREMLNLSIWQDLDVMDMVLVTQYFDTMKERNRPNSITIASVLSACERVANVKQMHCLAIKLGVEMDVYVATSLVTMYSNFEEMVLATRVFAETPSKNVIHGLIVKFEMQFDTMVGTALVDMYSKCGCWHLAYNFFKELNGSRNLMTWNSMIAGLMLNGQSEKAVELFEKLEHEELKPDSASWNSMISGFAQVGKGFEAVKHVRPTVWKRDSWHVIRTDIHNDEFMATTLIYMYMKCGHPSLARNIFEQFETRPYDPAFWNAMISGYGRNGDYDSAIEVFDLMQKEKVKPNSASFVGVICL